MDLDEYTELLDKLKFSDGSTNGFFSCLIGSFGVFSVLANRAYRLKFDPASVSELENAIAKEVGSTASKLITDICSYVNDSYISLPNPEWDLSLNYVVENFCASPLACADVKVLH